MTKQAATHPFTQNISAYLPTLSPAVFQTQDFFFFFHFYFILECLGGNFPISSRGASLVAQMVKNPPAMQETQVQSLGQEDPLEKGMTTHSRILAWSIPGTEEPDGLQSMGSQRVRHD